jgi:hypothetical protein
MTTEEKQVLTNDLEIFEIQHKNVMRDIRASRGGIMVRQLVEQLNALESVMDRLKAKLNTAKVTTKAKK